MTDRQILAEVVDYLGLIAALRDRAAELGIAMGSDNAAEISGLSSAYLARLMTPKTSGKLLSIESFGIVLGLLGVKILLVEDGNQTARMARRIKRRAAGYVRDGVCHIAIPKKNFKEMGLKGGKNLKARIGLRGYAKIGRKGALIRHKGGPASIRSYNARVAALARWAKHREEHR
jgi:hypothetical protein